MDTTARSIRDDRIVHLRSRDMPWRKIAREVNLTERQCRRVYAQRMGTGAPTAKPTEQSRVDLAAATSTELLDTVQAQFSKLEAIAAQLARRRDFTTHFRIVLTAREGDRAIDELRRRRLEFDSFRPADETADGCADQESD
jgi:hypothetical protein